MVDKEEQENELLALESIYDASVFGVRKKEGCCPEGHFFIRVDVPKPFHMLVPRASDPDKLQEIPLEHLPPVVLDFQLPPDYPSRSAPRFCLSCPWLTLSQLEVLIEALDRSWEQDPNTVVLFRWMNLLDTEAANILELTSSHNLAPLFDQLTELQCHLTLPRWKKYYTGRCNGWIDMRAFAVTDPRTLATVLSEYNTQEKQRLFKLQWLTCQVCFTSKLGSEFELVIGCEHPFCRDCLRKHFHIQIESGCASKLRCPQEHCTMQVVPAQVKELLGDALGSRYEESLFRAYLDSQEDLTYCPRLQCQLPAFLDLHHHMGQCASCQFVFCIYCRMAYHGVHPCRSNAGKRALRDDYLTATPAVKKEMEKRHGKRTLQILVEELLSEDWMQENSRKCPRCGVYIEKQDGCNKMTCWRCGTHFCWICGVALIMFRNPYEHFSDATTPCFNKLYEGAEEMLEGFVFEEDDHEFGEFL
ncbi:hypothetical protein MTO96_005091 [Rhipicephalus appendiculatus]